MFADFREYYGLRLSDMLKFDGSLPVWEVAVLAKSLPLTSRTAACLNGGMEYWGWGVDRHILVSLLDAVNINTYAFASANSKKKLKPFKETPRPGDAEKRQQEKLNNPFAKMLQAQMQQLDVTDEVVIEE